MVYSRVDINFPLFNADNPCKKKKEIAVRRIFAFNFL